MKKYFKLIVAGFIALVFIGTFVFLWIQSRPKTVEYEEITPTVKDIRKTSVITGKIEPRNEVAVKPQISGIITDIYKDAGEMVTEGEVIAKVKVIPDMAQLSSAEARVRLANINMEQAKVDYEREKVLYDKGLVSADEYDKVHQTYKQAQEEVAASQDNLEVVRDLQPQRKGKQHTDTFYHHRPDTRCARESGQHGHPLQHLQRWYHHRHGGQHGRLDIPWQHR